MSAIDHLLREPAAQAIGWALLHFIWQGTLVAALTAVALACLRNGAADIRYVISAIGLSLMLTLPAVTAAQLWRSDGSPDFRPKAEAGRELAADATRDDFRLKAEATGQARPRIETVLAPSSSRLVDSMRIEPWLPMLVFAWICGVAILSLRLVSGWLWVQRMKSHGTSPVEDGWDVIAARLSRRLHIQRTVRLLRSTLVDVPTVIGWLKPVILVPASALSGLNPHQLEAIMAHELAHIRRHDYLVNLLQVVVETLLFYHPAVWWLSRRIRAERENCCDDLAVSLCGDPFTYAQALADLEGLRGPARRFVIAADGGSLVQRVRRLLGAPSHAGPSPGWLAGSASVLVLLGIAAGTAGTNAFQVAQSATVTTAPRTQTQSEESGAKTEQQLRNDARAMTAAAERMTREANMVRGAAMAATALQAATHQATTPLLAGQTLEARAAALEDTAPAMSAEAAHSLDAASTRQQTIAMATEPALSDATRTRVVMEAAVVASTRPLGRTLAAVTDAALARQSHGTYSWSNNGQKLEIRYDGDVEFTDDDTDVKRLSPGGSLRIRDGGMMTSLAGGRTAEFTTDASGNITRRFWVGSSERPFDPKGRKWVASVLPRLSG